MGPYLLLIYHKRILHIVGWASCWHLCWQRAYVENIPIARIMRDQDAEHKSLWSVNFHIGDALSDACLTRQDAIEWVEHRFASFLESDVGKSAPRNGRMISGRSSFDQ